MNSPIMQGREIKGSGRVTVPYGGSDFGLSLALFGLHFSTGGKSASYLKRGSLLFFLGCQKSGWGSYNSSYNSLVDVRATKKSRLDHCLMLGSLFDVRDSPSSC